MDRPTVRIEVRLVEVGSKPPRGTRALPAPPAQRPESAATEATRPVSFPSQAARPPRQSRARPAPAQDAARPVEAAPPRVPRRGAVVAAYFGILLLVNSIGLPYYLLPISERMRSPLHAWFKPSGFIGQGAGVLAFVFLLFLWLYPLRKKYRWLAFTGSLPRWLDVHVVVGLSIPLLGATHAGWRFNGLIGLGYGAILVVWLSGMVGRYLYSRIPRSKTGLEMDIREVGDRRAALLTRIVEGTGLDAAVVEGVLAADPIPYTGLGPFQTLRMLVSDDLRRWRAVRTLRRRCRGRLPRAALSQILRLARRQMALTQQVRLLDATQQVFRYWHVAHRPVAITALLAAVIHVAVVVALGVTWFW